MAQRSVGPIKLKKKIMSNIHSNFETDDHLADENSADNQLAGNHLAGNHSANDIVEQFESHLQQLNKLARLCQQQELLIDEGDLPRLMRLLSQKNPIVTKLQNDSQRVRQVTQSLSLADDDPVRETLRQLKQQCDQRGSDILAAESRCESKLASSRDTLSQQMQEMNVSSGATSSYQSVADNLNHDGGSSLDLQCG